MHKRITEVIYQQIYIIYNARIKAEISRSLNIHKLKNGVKKVKRVSGHLRCSNIYDDINLQIGECRTGTKSVRK